MVTCEGVRHGWSYIRKVIEEFELANDLILNGRRQGFQFFDGSRKEFNLSSHSWPFWL